MITRDRVRAVTDGMSLRRVVVVGDAMLDVYLVGDVHRISPEAPVPVVAISGRRRALGGAGNVAANAAAMGAVVTLVAAIGDDQRAEYLRMELAMAGINDGALVTVRGHATTTKTRVVARGQQLLRFDEESAVALSDVTEELLVAEVRRVVTGADVVLIADYNKGVMTPAVIFAALEGARARGIPTVVDPKFDNFFAYGGATVFKPNRTELDTALGAVAEVSRTDELSAVMAQLGVQNLLLTLGSDGMALIEPDGVWTHIPTVAHEVCDVCGAGDTATAWVGTALAAGATVREAAELANLAAGIEVGKAGVAVVTRAEVLALAEAKC